MIGDDCVVSSYGELIKAARTAQSPPMSAKELADYLRVKPPFITDIEKGRRLPSLENQRKIKKKLACDRYPETMFDDLAAADNEDVRIVAEDLAKAIRKQPALRNLIRLINEQKLSATQISKLSATIGGNRHG